MIKWRRGQFSYVSADGRFQIRKSVSGLRGDRPEWRLYDGTTLVRADTFRDGFPRLADAKARAEQVAR